MRTPAKSNALRAELDRRKTTAEVLELDVTSPESVTNAMAHLEATGGLDVLINNAGVQGVRVSRSIWTTKRSSAYSRRTSSALFERRELHCPYCERVRKRA
jgi:NAD(P)-dependent dehydrogenase (short-subunit alcohol dehydrogenase family)